MKILVVDNSVMGKKQYEWVANLIPQHRELIDIWISYNNEPPQKMDRYDRIILLGSEASALDDHDWLKPELDLIQIAIDHGIPLLGICFGHQIIVYAALGRDYVRRRAYPELGWPEIRLLKKNKLFQDIANPFFSYSFHFDEVINSPELEVLARSDECEIQAYQLKNKDVWGIQFHPEIDIETGKRILRESAQNFQWDNVEKILAKACDSSIGSQLLHNFLEEI
ncbi:MAG: type 1 glutamine amidotransferase [Promethearchaeota archaeon]